MDPIDTAGTDTSLDRADRLRLALREIALVIVVIVVQWVVAQRLRPDDLVDRDITSAPFQWSAVLWIAVLLRSAYQHDGDPIQAAEGKPMVFGAVAGLAAFTIGLVSSSATPIRERLGFLVVHSLGVSIFWWAIAAAVGLAIVFSRTRTPAQTGSWSTGSP